MKKAEMAKRCLTVPSEGRGNDGYDNEHNDLILNVDDVLSSSSRRCAQSICLSGPLKKLVYTLHQCSGGGGGGGGRGDCTEAFTCTASMTSSVLNLRYIVRDLLGQGTFGQVVRCVREDSREEVAVKVIKNQTAFYHQVPSCALCF